MRNGHRNDNDLSILYAQPLYLVNCIKNDIDTDWTVRACMRRVKNKADLDLPCPHAYISHRLVTFITLRKHAFSNILKILPPKKIRKFSDKNSDIFHISAQNIDCGYLLEPSRRGGSNEYPQSMFLSSNKNNNVYPCKPQFFLYKSRV